MTYNNKNACSLQVDKRRVSHLLSKWQSCIGVVIAIVVLYIGAVTTVTAGGGGGNDSWLASQYKIPNALDSEESASYDTTIIRLVYVIPSSSETLVELEIEDPQIGKGSSEVTFVPIAPVANLTLLGFDADFILRSQQVKIAPGKQRIVLDLPPLTRMDAVATIQLKDLQKRSSTTGVLTTIAGPWLLSFMPNVQPERLISKKFDIHKYAKVGDVQVLLEKGLISSTETLVYYRILDTTNITREPLGQPTLIYADKVFRGKNKISSDGSPVLSFPALPLNVSQFTVNFPRMMSLDGPGGAFSIPVGNYLKNGYSKDKKIPMSEVVEFSSSKFQFTNLVVSENSFVLYYQPTSESPWNGLLLAGPGPLSDIIEARDDKGSLYKGTSSGATFDRQNFNLKEQSIGFEGCLDPQSRELNLMMSSTGVVGEAFVFNIEIVE
jgi:hypothetical protein